MLRRSQDENLVVRLLQEVEHRTLEDIVALLPALTWNEIFHAVDTLSRGGGIVLRRRGFSYDLCLPAVTRKTA